MQFSGQKTILTGIRSYRPNPIVINKQDPYVVEASKPVSSNDAFEAIEFDKDHSFNLIQDRWFHKKLALGETINLTSEQLKMICDESHEMGRFRERKLKICNCPIQC
jgi:hypothetical protein